MINNCLPYSPSGPARPVRTGMGQTKSPETLRGLEYIITIQ